jgi:hypothetical protein
MGQRVIYCSVSLTFVGVDVDKPSLNRALVAVNRPETGRSIHGQNEGTVKCTGGSNPLMLQN